MHNCTVPLTDCWLSKMTMSFAGVPHNTSSELVSFGFPGSSIKERKKNILALVNTFIFCISDFKMELLQWSLQTVALTTAARGQRLRLSIGFSALHWSPVTKPEIHTTELKANKVRNMFQQCTGHCWMGINPPQQFAVYCCCISVRINSKFVLQ